MEGNLGFLREFPKERHGFYIVYDLFRLLLKSDFDHEEDLFFILANCS